MVTKTKHATPEGARRTGTSRPRRARSRAPEAVAPDPAVPSPLAAPEGLLEAIEAVLPAAQQLASEAADAAVHVARAAAREVSRTAGGMLGLSGERMSRVDTAWLRMDNPHNLMVILGVWTLVPRLDYEAICARIAERLLQYPRFRQRVVEDATGATWVDVPDLDIHNHVVRERLPQVRRGQEQKALQAFISKLATTPLDRRRPLWKMHVIENYRDEHGREATALVVRIHHCIADGIALIHVTMSLVDGARQPPKKPKAAAHEAPPALEEWLAHTLLRPLTDFAVRALDAAGDGAAASLHLLRDPARGVSGTLDVAADAARMGVQVLNDAAALALMPDDAKTSLKGKASRTKRVAWTDPLPLDEVKAVGKAFHASINDVLLTAVSGAIGTYLQSRGEEVQGKEIRAMIPVNLRPLEEAWKLGNRFGLVPLLLPIGIENPVERLYEVRRRMRELKGSTQPLLAFGLLAVAGLLVKPAQDAMLNLFARKTTAVMTNVPGPREKLKFCGATLEQTMFWVPQSGDIGLGISILSYGGGVQFGVIGDARLCPEPQAIIDAFRPEFDKLATLALMLPWEE